ncbi:hypothetical protein Pmani_031523 [Petrolisthes manimaculis]|uniref:Uncharacterized protein n=1 Tax=Petrolisthes manimaculis TaxID=1843537 RepID=A0AAE1NV03_9EUCA|nr:hypothetical protein Pmani_031523 [Petrolisthes manimaculis]
MKGTVEKCCIITQLAAVALLLLQSVVVLPTTAMSDCTVKKLYGNKIKLRDTSSGYFRTYQKNVHIKMSAKYTEECKQSDLEELPHLTSPSIYVAVGDLTPASVNRDKSESWYDIGFFMCEKILIRIGSRVTELALSEDTKCKPESLEFVVLGAKLRCPTKTEEIDLRSKCSEVVTLQPLIAPANATSTQHTDINVFKFLDTFNSASSNFTPDFNIPDSKEWFVDTSVNDNNTFGSDDASSQWPYGPSHTAEDLWKVYRNNAGQDDTLSLTNPVGDRDLYEGVNYHNRSEENAIPIFIGVMAFTLSMCMRFCLCRGKGVVQRVTTVTVIRSRTVPDTHQDEENQHDPTLDPPPAYIDVVNEANPSTSQIPQEPPPPAYSDIEPPPYYSELTEVLEETAGVESSTEGQERQVSPHPKPIQVDAAPQDEPNHRGISGTCITTGAVTAGGSGSSLSRALSKTRTQQKQFSFKPLEEEEEE